MTTDFGVHYFKKGNFVENFWLHSNIHFHLKKTLEVSCIVDQTVRVMYDYGPKTGKKLAGRFRTAAMRAGSGQGLKNPARADLCFQVQRTLYS